MKKVHSSVALLPESKKSNSFENTESTELQTLRDIDLSREYLEECYICFEEITHENPAMFLHKCKHHICMPCLELLNNIKSKRYLENTSRCGICRARSNKCVIDTKYFHTKPHNSFQSIYVPNEILEDEKHRHPHFDYIQQIIVMG